MRIPIERVFTKGRGTRKQFSYIRRIKQEYNMELGLVAYLYTSAKIKV